MLPAIRSCPKSYSGGNHEGRQGNWKRRFAVLKEDLYYYESEESYQDGKFSATRHPC